MMRPNKMKAKISKGRSTEVQLQPQLSGVSDDIWMKTFGYADSNPSMFDVQQKEAEMSVSDPEEYLLSRSDEDVALFPPHSTVDTRTLNSPNQHPHLAEEDYVTSSVEFSECVDRGMFCREGGGSGQREGVVHFHCPCCVKHNEPSVEQIEQHYRNCVRDSRQTIFSRACKHDDYIIISECRSSDDECPAGARRLPIHYHCPCCLIHTQQNVFQVLRHQVLCCKTLRMMAHSGAPPPLPTPGAGPGDVVGPGPARGGPCTHDQNLITFRLCYSPYCMEECATRKNLHFHCTCCHLYVDHKLRSLRKHQAACCTYSNYGDLLPATPKVQFVIETSAALTQCCIVLQNRKRSLPSDPMALLSSKKRPVRKSTPEDIADELFEKCNRSTPECQVQERNRNAHYHCPACRTYIARRLERVKLHYLKCIKPKARAKPRGQPLDLQVELLDKLNRVFLVRGSSQGPGMPVHVIFRAGPSSAVTYCENGCDRAKVAKCQHVAACEQFVRDKLEISETGPDLPPLNTIDLFYNYDEQMKGDVTVLVDNCAEHRVPVIKPYYPQASTCRPVTTYYSVSTSTTPQFFSKTNRVLVSYNERSHLFKCKCGQGVCVHILVAQLYHSNFSVNSSNLYGGDKEGDSADKDSCSSEYFIA